MDTLDKLATLDQLTAYIESTNPDELRAQLHAEYDRLFAYRNISEWNRLVRVCEALAIVGWGEREAVEAFANKWINGSWYTHIQNRFFEEKTGHGGRWAKMGDTYVLDHEEADRTDHGIAKFASQRNRLPKCPIRWSKSGNYQKSAKPFYDALDILRDKFIRQTRPEAYGCAFSHIGINLWFSHHDEHGSMAYEYFHDEADVPAGFQGKYYIRPRLDIGKLSTKEGELRLIATRHFSRAFGELPLAEQKRILRDDFLEIVDALGDKLRKKKIGYDTDLLKQDICQIMAD